MILPYLYLYSNYLFPTIMPPKTSVPDFLRAFKLLHPFFNSASSYLIYIIFVTLIIQTFLRLNNRLCVKYSSVIAKWACLAFIALLENYTSQIVVGSIAICAAEVILLFIIVQGLNTKNQTIDNQVGQQKGSTIHSNKNIICLQVLRWLLRATAALAKHVPTAIRIRELSKDLQKIKQLFSLPRESIEISPTYVGNLQQFAPEPQKQVGFTTFGDLGLINTQQKQDSKEKVEDIPQDNLTKKKTMNSQEISAIIKPNSELQTLLSPNEELLMFHFEDASRSPIWGELMKPSPIPQQIPELSEDPSIMGYNCDQMIQLTKKSFEFFREVLITKSLQGIQIMVKNSSGSKRKFYSNFSIEILNDQILSITSQKIQRYFRLESPVTLKSFQRYLKEA